jgi:uncharacterized SAM-binding protein YcdF (DUF218 family)
MKLTRKVANDRGRRRRIAVYLGPMIVAAAAAWLAGLIWYGAGLPERTDDAARATDAIVVLTGGSGRLEEGLRLLAEQRAGKLFVSGVYRGVDVRQLLDAFQESAGGLECCVVLGYEAISTRGNAEETAAWMAEQGFQSMRLVTASYHMPRSLLEFRRSMPDIEVLAHPVVSPNFKQRDWWRWPGSARLLISEYNKYLAAVLFGAFGGPAGVVS